MGRPRKFYIAYGENSGRSRVVEGLRALHKATGQRWGRGYTNREQAEEDAAWRDYRYGPDKPYEPRT